LARALIALGGIPLGDLLGARAPHFRQAWFKVRLRSALGSSIGFSAIATVYTICDTQSLAIAAQHFQYIGPGIPAGSHKD
jgi:hypothetical protein